MLTEKKICLEKSIFENEKNVSHLETTFQPPRDLYCLPVQFPHKETTHRNRFPQSQCTIRLWHSWNALPPSTPNLQHSRNTNWISPEMRRGHRDVQSPMNLPSLTYLPLEIFHNGQRRENDYFQAICETKSLPAQGLRHVD